MLTNKSCYSPVSLAPQDFRTGYITLASPKAMFVSQVVGAIMGVFLAPLTFQLFWSTGEVGHPDGPYPNPLAKVSNWHCHVCPAPGLTLHADNKNVTHHCRCTEPWRWLAAKG